MDDNRLDIMVVTDGFVPRKGLLQAGPMVQFQVPEYEPRCDT